MNQDNGDPALVATEVVQASDIEFCKALIEKMPVMKKNDWSLMWQHINEKRRKRFVKWKHMKLHLKERLLQILCAYYQKTQRYLRAIVCQFVIQTHSSSHRIKHPCDGKPWCKMVLMESFRQL